MEALVINTIKHNGTTYQPGDKFKGSKDEVKVLIAAGALRDKNAVEEQDEVDAQVMASNARAEAEQIVADAKAEAAKLVEAAQGEADKIKSDATQVAEDTKKAAKDVGEQIVADANAKIQGQEAAPKK